MVTERLYGNLDLLPSVLPYGLVVRIPAFHAGGPGSIPGVGTHFHLKTKNMHRKVMATFDLTEHELMTWLPESRNIG